MTFLFRHRYALVLGAAIVTFFCLAATRYLGAGRDDVFITLYAGQMLAEGHGLVNYNSERVEMSSSLLHTLVVATIDRVAPAYVFTLNKIAGGIAGALTLVMLYLGRGVLFRVGKWRFPVYLLTLVIVATNPAFLYWSLGGLETPFAALFLTGYAIALLHHRLRATPIAEFGIIATQCLFILTRPEGFYLILFTGVYLAFMKVIAGRPLRLRIWLIPVAFFSALSLFRVMYFGSPLPNTVYAKSGGIAEGLANGSVYVANFYSASPFLMAAFAMQAVLFIMYARSLVVAAQTYPRRTPVPLTNILLFGLVLAAQCVVLFSGGDWMEHFRFMVPVFPLLAAMTITGIAAGIAAVERRVDNRAALIGAAGTLAIATCVVNVNQSSLNIPRMLPLENRDAGIEYSLRETLREPGPLDNRIIRLNAANRGFLNSFDPFLDEVFGDIVQEHQPIVIATGQMGLFPYRIKQRFPEAQITFVDTLGLCDATVAHLPMPKDPIGLKDGRFVDAVLSHESGPLSEYVISQNPNMAYMLGGALDLTKNLARMNALGFNVVWDRNHEYVFLKRAD